VLDTQNPMVLREDLYSSDGTLIVQKGEIVTSETIKEIAQKSPRGSTRMIPLKESTFFKDFFSVLNEEKYQIVFDREDVKAWVLDLVGKIILTTELIQELEFFKNKDYYSYRHILMTTAMTARMMNDLYHDPAIALVAASISLTHDLGKSRVPLDILQSSKKLTYDEKLYILEHPWTSALLLTYYTGESEAIHSLVSCNHHEKMDGSGYPSGIQVDAPITQMITIADMFDAMISWRPYRLETFDIRGALDYLCDEAELGRLNMSGVKQLISYNRHTKPPLESVSYSKDHLGRTPAEDLNNYSSPGDCLGAGTQEPNLAGIGEIVPEKK
jgi:HD-GYP domain-containing protein (c-di-GMP phosphodiesterase class II)